MEYNKIKYISEYLTLSLRSVSDTVYPTVYYLGLSIPLSSTLKRIPIEILKDTPRTTEGLNPPPSGGLRHLFRIPL